MYVYSGEQTELILDENTVRYQEKNLNLPQIDVTQ